MSFDSDLVLYIVLHKTKKSRSCEIFFVIPKRFERLTHALEGRCSIQLSYGTNLVGDDFSFPSAKIVRLFGCTKNFLLFFINYVLSVLLSWNFICRNGLPRQ